MTDRCDSCGGPLADGETDTCDGCRVTMPELCDDLAASIPPCPACGGQGGYLGTLGTTDHYRCINCGATYHETKETDR